MAQMKKIQELVADLGWETDRMSRSGVETWEQLCTLVGVDTSPATEEEIAAFEAEMKKRYSNNPNITMEEIAAEEEMKKNG